MPSELGRLMAVVTDNLLPLPQRRDAAALIVKLRRESIPPVSDTDEEVVELMRPWPQRTEDEVLLAESWADATNGRSLRGVTLEPARNLVQARHKLRAVLAMVVDHAEHELVRLAACAYMLSSFAPGNHFRMNGYTPQRLLEIVSQTDSTRWDGRTVTRPPLDISDVWEM